MQRLKNKPFVLLGVNSDKDPEKLKKDLVTHQINWRSFKNQRSEGVKVSQTWHVKGWPTFYLIDHKGVIRQKWLGKPDNNALEQMIETLIREAESDRTKG